MHSRKQCVTIYMDRQYQITVYIAIQCDTNIVRFIMLGFWKYVCSYIDGIEVLAKRESSLNILITEHVLPSIQSV